jgi:hypothetical protein
VQIPAGKNMTEHYHSKGTADENIESLDISTKSCQSDFATAIDVKNENFIAGEINKAFPDHEVSLHVMIVVGIQRSLLICIRSWFGSF